MTVVREALLKLSQRCDEVDDHPGAVDLRCGGLQAAGGERPTMCSGSCGRVDVNFIVTIDHLGEDTTKVEQATKTTRAYLELLGRLSDAGLADIMEVSVKLSAVGQFLGADGERIATENARLICAAAGAAAFEWSSTWRTTPLPTRRCRWSGLPRMDFPWLGTVLQAYLHRTEDCRDLASPAGSACAKVPTRSRS